MHWVYSIDRENNNKARKLINNNLTIILVWISIYFVYNYNYIFK